MGETKSQIKHQTQKSNQITVASRTTNQTKKSKKNKVNGTRAKKDQTKAKSIKTNKMQTKSGKTGKNEKKGIPISRKNELNKKMNESTIIPYNAIQAEIENENTKISLKKASQEKLRIIKRILIENKLSVSLAFSILFAISKFGFKPKKIVNYIVNRREISKINQNVKIHTLTFSFKTYSQILKNTIEYVDHKNLHDFVFDIQIDSYKSVLNTMMEFIKEEKSYQQRKE